MLCQFLMMAIWLNKYHCSALPICSQSLKAARRNHLSIGCGAIFGWENELVFLFADSGIGKSILATQIAYEIAKGESECADVEISPQKYYTLILNFLTDNLQDVIRTLISRSRSSDAPYRKKWTAKILT